MNHNREDNPFIWKIPSWMTKWGVTLIALIMAAIAVCSYIIKYPQFITSTVIITTTAPPVNLVARANGNIERLFVRDGDNVSPEQSVALIRSSAKYEDIMQVEKLVGLFMADSANIRNLIESQILDKTYSLGELQNSFSEFLKTCKAYKNYLNVNHITKKQRLLQLQINKGLQQYKLLEEQRNTYNKELEIASKSLKRDSTLLSMKTISMAEYERAVQQNLQKQETKSSLDANMVNTELGIMQTRQQIVELSIQQERDIAEYEESLSVLGQQVLNMIKTWKETYLITSPVSGKITFVNYWAENQTITNGESFAGIIPPNGIEIIGKMSVPSAGLGKVKEGADVNVKLSGFPYMEFGMLRGQIKRISAVPDAQNTYRADIVFPNGLKTNYNKELPLIQNMDGVAEIITEDMRLIEHFWQPLKAAFKR